MSHRITPILHRTLEVTSITLSIRRS